MQPKIKIKKKLKLKEKKCGLKLYIYIYSILYIFSLWENVLGVFVPTAMSSSYFSAFAPHQNLLVFLSLSGGRCPVARNTSEMGISCSLGQQGLHTALAGDRNSCLRQGMGGGLEGRGTDSKFPWGALRGGFPMPWSFPLLHSNPEDVPECHGRRGPGSPHTLAGCPGALWQTLASMRPGRVVGGDSAQGAGSAAPPWSLCFL